MKKFFPWLAALGLLAGLARPVSAQTTNGVTTGAERQALNDAATQAAQRRANAPGTSGSTGSSSGSSSSGRALTQTENEARVNALFGFKTAEQKAAEARQNAQRYRDVEAAAAAKRDKDAAFNRSYSSATTNTRLNEEAAAEAAKPLVAADLDPADAWEMSGFTHLNVTTGQPYGKPDDFALIARVTAARQAFLALAARPEATYEQLREVAGQLAKPDKPSYGLTNYGVATALNQYAYLLKRFPAHRASASADVLRAATANFDEGGALFYGGVGVESGREAARLLLLGASENLAEGYLAAARLAPKFTRPHVGVDRDGTNFTGEVYVGAGMRGDTAQIARVMRFCYVGSLHLLGTGQPPAAGGLSAAEMSTNAAKLALSSARIQMLENHPLAAQRWLVRAVRSNDAIAAEAAKDFQMLARLHPDMLWSLPVIDWPRFGLKTPVELAETRRWLADTVRIPDHPGWQTLTPAQRAALQEAQTLAIWFNDQRVDARLQVATWSVVLAPTDQEARRTAEAGWRDCAYAGSLPAVRNLYRSYLLRDRKNPHDVVSSFASNNANDARARYLAALLLLDELPGYPPLGKRNKGEGKRLLQEAAAAGNLAAAERLRR